MWTFNLEMHDSDLPYATLSSLLVFAASKQLAESCCCHCDSSSDISLEDDASPCAAPSPSRFRMDPLKCILAEQIRAYRSVNGGKRHIEGLRHYGTCRQR